MPYNAMVSRTGTGGEFPRAFAQDVIGDIRTMSTAISLGNVIQTESRDSRIPVLSQDVESYWVAGDSGLKGVSAPQWQAQSLYAEELAVVVPVPDSVINDAAFPIWAAVRPLVARAFARRIDRAAIFGIEKPSTWPAALVDVATTASATVEATGDAAADLLAAAELVSAQELTPTAVAVRSGYQYAAAVARTDAFHANPVTESQPFPLSIAGLPIATDPVTWDQSKAEAVVAAWDNVMVGIRQDMTFSLHTDGVITNESGTVVTNLMQQDTTALRAVMRVGYMLRRPVIAGNTPTVPISIVTPAA